MNVFFLGLKALWRQRTLLLFTSAGLAAVLGPLLLLYGFKFGVIAALLADLRNNPTNREIVLRGNYVVHPADIAKYRSWKELSFVQPETRSIAARMELVVPPPGKETRVAGVLPSGEGDPLLPKGMVLASDQIALSASLAERLHVKAGDRLLGRNQRGVDNGYETFEAPFTVAYVIDRRFAPGERAYTTVDMLVKLEAFLDGYEVPDLHLKGKPLGERPDTMESVRLYARTIEDVLELDHRFAALGFDVYTHADEVAGVLNLNTNLAAVFTLIAVIGSLGYTVSLAASLLGNIAQQRKLLSLIRLMGAGRGTLILFPLAQGLAISGAGFALSAALFLAVARLANLRFSGMLPDGALVCRLEPLQFAAALGGTFAVVGVVVLWVGRTLLSVSPAEVLHAE
ncbi:MAG TPA: hypothetical protein VMI56_17670 [Reyranella sp.]|nr:hypothetical protein [Reyranella sp.]